MFGIDHLDESAPSNNGRSTVSYLKEHKKVTRIAGLKYTLQWRYVFTEGLFVARTEIRSRIQY